MIEERRENLLKYYDGERVCFVCRQNYGVMEHRNDDGVCSACKRKNFSRNNKLKNKKGLKLP